MNMHWQDSTVVLSGVESVACTMLLLCLPVSHISKTIHRLYMGSVFDRDLDFHP